MLGHRVALRFFSVELGTAMLSGWRRAADDEPETPLLGEVDHARERALWIASLRLFARMGTADRPPGPADRSCLRWLAGAPWLVRWRQDIGLVPSLGCVSVPVDEEVRG